MAKLCPRGKAAAKAKFATPHTNAGVPLVT